MPRAPADLYRPFVCEECNRSYTRGHDLLRHQRKHNGEYIACPAEGCRYKTEQLANLTGHYTRKHINAKRFKCGRCDRSYDDEAALKRHLNRKHKGDDGSGGPLADVQVFVESSGQGSTGRLVTPPLSQGSGGSGDSRGSTAGPSTPTVVESPRMRDIQIPAEVVESTEDWYRRCFPDEGTFGPSPPGAQSLSANGRALNGRPYYQNQMDHHANAFATRDPAFDTHARYSGDSSLDMVPWPGWDMPMPPYYSQSFNGSGV